MHRYSSRVALVLVQEVLVDGGMARWSRASALMAIGAHIAFALVLA